jgi:hypothetical protein
LKLINYLKPISLIGFPPSGVRGANMTKIQTKAFLYQLAAFALFFIPLRLLLGQFTPLTGYWIPMVAFVIATVFAPKFQAVKTKEGEKLFMKIVFVKGVKEIS